MTHQNFDASITPSTSSANEGEGKRNRKAQLLSALLSASALGLFLEGCGGSDTSTSGGSDGGGGNGGGGNGGGGNGGGGIGGGDSESDPQIATANADLFDGDWVSYERSTAGVTINLNDASASGGWAEGDNVHYTTENIIGSDHADTLIGDYRGNSFEGGRGNDVLAGDADGHRDDTYVFNAGDGSDRVEDDTGNIIFEQGTNNDYTGATYTFATVANNEVRLTVTKGGNTLNTITFSTHPSDYYFYTRSGSSNTRIPDSSLGLPARPGSASNPFLATSGTDVFAGAGRYDWVSYAGSNAGVRVDLGSNTASGGWAAGDTLTNIDSLIGSAHADRLTGDSGVNTLRGGSGNDILEGKGGSDILEGGVGQDDYIFDNSDDTIRSDSDGGRLLFRAASGQSEYDFERNSNGDVVLSLGNADITIVDGGSDDAYQHGIYSIHYGTSDTFSYNLYAGRNSADTITGSSGTDLIYGLSGNDKLYGGNGNDQIFGGSGDDLLDGERGYSIMNGGSGDDTYRFDAGTGTSIDQIEGGIIFDTDLSGNNKVIFRAPSGVTYTNDNFVFVRGTFSGGDPFTVSESGEDLFILAFTGSVGSPDTQNIVFIDNYFFGQTSNYDIYTIYRTGYNSNSDGTIVSTQPAETA